MGKLYFITGNDEFAVKERSRELALELTQGELEDNPAAEIVPGDSDTLSLEEITRNFIEAVRTPPFLCDSKFIWLRHFANFDIFNSMEPGQVFVEAQLILTSPLPDDVTVLADGFNLDMRKSFGKALKTAKISVETLNTSKIGDKNHADDRRIDIRTICQELGKEIDGNATAYLTETLSGDSGVLRNELEKLACFVGATARITLADCQAICSRTPETVTWEFTGAISSRNAPAAIRLLDVLLAQGEAEMRLIAALSGEFQKQIQTKLAMRQLSLNGVNARTFDLLPQELRDKYPDNPLLKLHPYRAFKICESAANFTDEELVRNLELVRNANRDLVSGGGDRRIVLEQLILKATSKNWKFG
ncbi:MAG: DNA polymerase III subunit delta [Victivallales bacterium]|jgi:DNA polymerase-3 subunit delta|nr:DNA polymerase III subunit delta [Victivallales bacterium]